MEILLLNTNVSRSAWQGETMTPAPAGLISIAGVLKRRGHRPTIVQLHNHVLRQDEQELPLLRDEIRRILDNYSPAVVGISCRNVGSARRPANPFQLVQYYSAFYDSRVVRVLREESRVPVVMGGTGFSVEPALYMRVARPDFGIVGEAEEVLVALLDALQNGADPRTIPGVLTHESLDGDSALPDCVHIHDLAQIGPGACEAVEDFCSNYYDVGGFAPIQTRRGCALDCIYCTTPRLEGRCYRFRPMTHVIEEMRAYQEVWGVKHFFIVDSTFNHPLDHALEVCEGIAQSGLDVEWHAELNARFVTDELCRAMVAAGCRSVTMGLDSGSDAVLQAYRKPFDTADIANAATLLRKHGIRFDVTMILGGPGDTPETFRETIAFCEKHFSDTVVRFFSGMVIVEGTESHRIAVAEGRIDPSVTHTDIVLRNELKRIKDYEYFFPDVREGRKEFLESLAAACRRERWLLNNKDFAPDPETGDYKPIPEIAIRSGDRPWRLNMRRIPAPREASRR